MLNRSDKEAEIIERLPRLRRFARTLTRNQADADDLVQITIERAWTRFDQWSEGTNLLSWMFRIMKNAWIDETRKRSRADRVFAPPEAGEHVGAEDPAFEGRLEARDVDRAMQALPDEQRLAVSLVLVEGLSYREAAAVMETPIGTLTSRLARGRDALQAALAPDKGPEEGVEE